MGSPGLRGDDTETGAVFAWGCEGLCVCVGAVCVCVCEGGGSPGGTDGSAEPGVHLRRVGHLGGPSATLPVIKAPEMPTRRAPGSPGVSRVSRDPVL